MTTTIRPQVLTEWADDFVGFAAKLDILQDDGARVKLRPNPVQAAFEEVRTGRDIILKPRQIGFTTWELARDVWFFLTRPGARVTVLCKTEDKSKAVKELTGKLRVMFEGLASSGIRIEVQNDATDTWLYGDAALRIVECGGTSAAAGGVGRGGTVQRLHVTELAFFQFPQETLTAILPCVPDASDGTEVTVESTANGAAGAFYERYRAAQAGRGEFHPHFVRWTAHPKYQSSVYPNEDIVPENERETQLAREGCTAGQLKWYRRKVEDAGQEKVDQEFPSNEETCWLIPGRIFFDKPALNRALSDCVEPVEVEGDFRVWQKAVAGEVYIVVGDPAQGTGGDPSAGVVYNRRTGDHVATLHGQYTPVNFANALAIVASRYNIAMVVVERNNHGHAVIQSLQRGDLPTQRKAYPRVYIDERGEPGWNTNQVSRSAALDALEHEVRTGAWKTPDRRVIAEMLTFIVDKNGKAAATYGAHDDLVMATAIARDVLRRAIRVKREAPTPPPLGLSNFDTTPTG